MVICTYYLKGMCQFGAKCTNEHFDVKGVIKSDMETSITGKQWPLTCYGPFKDKPCIPDFITDQSFEEVRLLCYEAKQKNYFQQFHQQFTQSVMEANNKMKMLLTPSPQIVNLVIQLHDMATQNTHNNASSTTSNPFSSSNSNTNSIFGQNSQQNQFNTNNRQQSSLFAQSSAPNQTINTFSFATANSGGNLFGTLGQTNTQTGNNIFSTNNNNMSQQNGAFPNATTSNNLFAQPTQTTGSGFGLFGQQLNTQNNFAQPHLQNSQQSTNIFSQPGGNIFQQQNAPQTTMPSQPTTNLFSQNTSNMSTDQNLFTQPAVQNNAMQSNVFPQAPQTELAPNAVQRNVTQTSGCYSRLEDLKPEEIAAFQASLFELGKVPINPPPKEFVN